MARKATRSWMHAAYLPAMLAVGCVSSAVQRAEVQTKELRAAVEHAKIRPDCGPNQVDREHCGLLADKLDTAEWQARKVDELCHEDVRTASEDCWKQYAVAMLALL